MSPGRFEQEVEALRRLSSPRIPAVEVYEVEGADRFFVTRYIGPDLPSHLPGLTPAPSLPLRLELFADVVEAVATAHSVGVAHRDIKPNNVVVDEQGRASLIDFGICQVIGVASRNRQ